MSKYTLCPKCDRILRAVDSCLCGASLVGSPDIANTPRVWFESARARFGDEFTGMTPAWASLERASSKGLTVKQIRYMRGLYSEMVKDVNGYHPLD